MKNKNKYISLLIVLIICIGAIMPVYILFVNIEPVSAAGSVSVNITLTGRYELHTVQSLQQNFVYWCTHAASVGTTNQIGWYSDLLTEFNPDYQRTFPRSHVFYWSLAGIPAGAEIVDANIILRCSAKTDNSDVYSDFYWSFYKTNPGVDNLPTIDDADNWDLMRSQGYGRMTPPQHYTSLVVGAVDYIVPITADLDIALETWQATGNVYFQCMTENQALFWTPQWENDKGIKFDISSTIGSYPYLNITYVPPATPRNEDLHVNAPVDTTILGDETADNITLETLRCMYADETLSFLVNGDSGANVTLSLLDQDNRVLATHSDTVRTDNIYSWQINLPSNYSGFVKVHEANNNLDSAWVSVQPAPSKTEKTNYVYAGSTEYPQYTTPFSQYVVYDNGYMYVHWKTNIDPATELADYGLELLSNGSTSVFRYTLEDIATDYLGGSVTNQQGLTHWRYMVFTPGITQGHSDYGGLAYNLYFDQTKSIRTGFVQAVIKDSATWTNEIASTHSAYWYLSSPAKGLSIAFDHSSYSDEETPVIKLIVGDECKAETNLTTGSIDIAGDIVGAFTTELGNQDLVLKQLSDGSYVVSVSLSGSDHTYVYRYDIPLTVSDSGATGGTGVDEISDPNNILGLVKKIFGFINADSPGEKWIWLLVGMAIAAAMFWWSSIMRVVAPMVLFGAACVSGWIDPWWVILLALGAGVYIYSTFKKKTGEGSE